MCVNPVSLLSNNMHVNLAYVFILLVPQHATVLFAPSPGDRSHFHIKKVRKPQGT
jgi:hypothetical protein